MLNALGLFKNMAASSYVDTSINSIIISVYIVVLCHFVLSPFLFTLSEEIHRSRMHCYEQKERNYFNIVHLLYLLLIYFDSCQILGHGVAWRTPSIFSSLSLLNELLIWLGQW
jgi:hypothetical protein